MTHLPDEHNDYPFTAPDTSHLDDAAYSAADLDRLTGAPQSLNWDAMPAVQQLGFVLEDRQIDQWLKSPYLDTIVACWQDPDMGLYMRGRILAAWQSVQRDTRPLELVIQARLTPAQTRLSTRALASVEPEALAWLWEPYVLLNKVTLLEGDPGIGKTYVLLALAAALTNGYSLPDQDGRVAPADPARAANVLYVTAEDGLADTLRPRADLLGADTTRIYVPTLEDLYPGGQPAFTLGQLAPLEGAIAAHAARLVVLDPVQAFLGTKIDINQTNQVRPLMTALASLAARAGCAIVCVRHWTKHSAGKALYRGQASIDFAAAARSVLVIGTSPEDPALRILAQSKHNLTPHAKSIVFTITDRGLEWCGTSDLTADELAQAQPERQRSRQRQDAMAWLQHELRDGPRLSSIVKAAAEALGITERVLRDARETLGVITQKQGQQTTWCLPSYRPWERYPGEEEGENTPF